MIIAILGSIAAIAALCWLLFMLATYALPALGGVAAGMWAYQTGAGLPSLSALSVPALCSASGSSSSCSPDPCG